jgi:uncharacterized circularly permuted ATP-grasp superfamily protein
VPKSYGETLEQLQKKYNVNGFWDAIFKGKVSCSNAVGTEFINDKAFYVYVEDLIRFYLNEEPVLKNIETQFAATFNKSNGGAQLNEELLNRVIRHPKEYVIKGVNGRGGNQVWIGPKLKAEELKELVEKVTQNPSYYIIQKYTPLSTLDDSIVDLRLLSDVSSEGVITAPVPWGRSIPINGSGKVNLSLEGRETAMLISRAKTASCRSSLNVYH